MRTTSSCTLQGARAQQQDVRDSIDTKGIVMHIVCDGHGKGGDLISHKLVKTFKRCVLDTVLPSAESDKTATELDTMLLSAFDKAMTEVDTAMKSNPATYACNAGSTMSVVLYELSSKKCATLQLGDSIAAVCDATTGDIIYSTTDHQFANDVEVERMGTLRKHGWTFERHRRRDCSPPEDRWVGMLRGPDGQNYVFNEPSREIANPEMYPIAIAKELTLLQRQPVIHLFDVPPDKSPLLLCCSDGVISHRAFPNLSSLILCLRDPEEYMMLSNIAGTDLAWMLQSHEYLDLLNTAAREIGPASAAFENDPTEGCYKLMQMLAPDDRWQAAVQRSWYSIESVRGNYENNRVPPLLAAFDAAVEMTTNLAVLLMSDDNTTISATLIHTS